MKIACSSLLLSLVRFSLVQCKTDSAHGRAFDGKKRWESVLGKRGSARQTSGDENSGRGSIFDRRKTQNKNVSNEQKDNTPMPRLKSLWAGFGLLVTLIKLYCSVIVARLGHYMRCCPSASHTFTPSIIPIASKFQTDRHPLLYIFLRCENATKTRPDTWQ